MKRSIAVFVLATTACGGGSTPPPTAPKEYKTLEYDATKIPKGAGWQCYVVTPSTKATLSTCFRDAAACEEAQKKAGAEAAACASAKEAFCVTSASEASCSRSKDDCERFRVAQNERTSKCTSEN